MFNATDDDDFFSTPTSTSNLANLFGSNATSDLNASLIYSAPKQPKNSIIDQDDKVKPKPSQNKLICVKTIQLYKINETSSSSTLLGKYGIAIIGDVNINSYDLIIYKTKQQILSSTKLSPNCTYRELPDHQASLKDDQSQSWRVCFDDAKESAEFTSQLTSKGVKVVRLERSEQVSESIINTISMSDSGNKDRVEIKLDDSDSSGTQARQNILERISKVGQSMFPAVNTPPKNLDLSESEPEEIVKAKKILRKPKRLPEKDTHETMDPNQQFMVPKTSANIQQQQYTLLNGQYVPTQMLQCMPSPILSLTDPLSIYFTENRTHNSEVRMNLSHLSNKLESVLSEISSIKTSTPVENNFSKKIAEMEKRLESMGNGNELQKTRDMLGQVEEEKQAVCVQMEKLQNDLDRLKYKETLVDTQQSLINELNNTIENQKNKIALLEKSNTGEDANKELLDTIKNLRLKLKDFEDRESHEREDILRLSKLQEENEELKVTTNELQGNVVNLKLKLKDLEDHYKANPPLDKLEAARIKEEELLKIGNIIEENAKLLIIIDDLEKTVENLNLKLKDFDAAKLKGGDEENAELLDKIENLKLKLKDFEDYHKSNPQSEATKLKEEELLRVEEENVDLKSTVDQLQDKIDNMKLKLKDLEEYHRQTYQPDKLMAARLIDDKIKNFNDLVKQNMNEMYQNILERMDENNFNTVELKKSLISNMKNATFQILDEYRKSLNESDGNSKTPPPVPEFEVTV